MWPESGHKFYNVCSKTILLWPFSGHKLWPFSGHKLWPFPDGVASWATKSLDSLATTCGHVWPQIVATSWPQLVAMSVAQSWVAVCYFSSRDEGRAHPRNRNVNLRAVGPKSAWSSKSHSIKTRNSSFPRPPPNCFSAHIHSTKSRPTDCSVRKTATCETYSQLQQPASTLNPTPATIARKQCKRAFLDAMVILMRNNCKTWCSIIASKNRFQLCVT